MRLQTWSHYKRRRQYHQALQPASTEELCPALPPAHPSWARWGHPGYSCQAAGEQEGTGRGPGRSLSPCLGAATESWASLPWPMELLPYPRPCPWPLAEKGTDPKACWHLWPMAAPTGVLKHVEQSCNFKRSLMMFLYIIVVYRTWSFLPCIK